MTPPEKRDDDPAAFGHRLTFIEREALPDHHKKLGRLGQQMVELVGAHGTAGRVRDLEDDIKRIAKMIEVAAKQRDAVDARELNRITMLIESTETNTGRAIDALAARVGRAEDAHAAFPWRLLVVSLVSSLTMGVVLAIAMMAVLTK